jgi:hypothetical protein
VVLFGKAVVLALLKHEMSYRSKAGVKLPAIALQALQPTICTSLVTGDLDDRYHETGLSGLAVCWWIRRLLLAERRLV